MENENKNENVDNNVNQDVVSEEKVNNEDVIVHVESKKENNKSVIYVIVSLLILIILGVILFLFISSRDKNDEVDNNDNGNVNETTQNDDVPTFGDEEVDDKIDDELDDTISVDDKVINIYQKGYADNGPIAFTYECESESCDLKVTDKGFILYDDEVVKYREMTSYEYEQINNSEVSPVGGKLDMDGFEEVSTYDDTINIYKIDNNLYIVNQNVVLFKSYLETIVTNKIDNILYNNYYIYDILNDETLFVSERGSAEISYNSKKGSYYLFNYSDNSSSELIVIGNESKKYTFVTSHRLPWDDLSFIFHNIYIDGDKCYYINNRTGKRKISVINNKNDNLLYNNDGIDPIHIFDDKLIYLDKEGILSVKNLLDDNNIYKTDIKLKNAYLVGVEEGFQIFEIDKSILENEDFDTYRKYENINDEEFSKIKKCFNDSESCENSCYMVGNMINLDKEGKFISKEYYLTSSQTCIE